MCPRPRTSSLLLVSIPISPSLPGIIPPPRSITTRYFDRPYLSMIKLHLCMGHYAFCFCTVCCWLSISTVFAVLKGDRYRNFWLWECYCGRRGVYCREYHIWELFPWGEVCEFRLLLILCPYPSQLGTKLGSFCFDYSVKSWFKVIDMFTQAAKLCEVRIWLDC